MQFPEEYFEDEIREGFFVPSMIKRAWAAELEVLEQIDRICRRHNIQYFAEWGTLLGAVRHNGFIPWDDDLDIGMKRADYEKFLKVAESELPQGYKINNLHTRDDFWLFLARVMNTGHMSYDEAHLRKYHEFPYIAGVDIFLMDYVARDAEAEKTRDVLADYTITLADHIAEKNISVKDAFDGLNKLTQTGCIHGMYNRRYIESWLAGDGADDEVKKYIDGLHQYMYIQAERLFAKFSDKESDELTQLYPFGLRRKNHRYKKEYYEDCVRIPFENTTIPVPIGYDAMLRKRYGNYLEIHKDCSGHGYPFYESQQAQLDALMDITLPKYEYNETEKSYALGECRRAKAADSFEDIAHVVCEELYDIKDPYEAQQLAVDFGTLIEQQYGEGLETVGRLENYCELLYEQVQKGDAAEELRKCALEIAECVRKDIIDRKETVFVVSRTAQWQYIRAEYLKAVQSDCKIYVIPVPYFHKRYDGALYDEHCEYEAFLELLQNTPENVRVVKYNEYDIALHTPAVVYIQNPYDEWNEGISIHPVYYTGKLLESCETMIYVPPFAVDEFTDSDEREYHNMKHYVLVPGVVRAHRVIVQSEALKKVYCDKLTEWAGEDSRSIWEQKLVGTGNQTTVADRQATAHNEQKLADMPDEVRRMIYKPDGSRKKIILYHNEVGFFLENGAAAAAKVRRALEVFKDNSQDIAVVWNFPGCTMESVRRTNPKLAGEIEELAACARDIGIHDMSDGHAVAELADAYYGDGCYLSRICQKNGVPVMIESVEI